MDTVIVPAILGVFLIFLGIANRKGNIASLHWYHRRKVTEENRIPFGKLVGAGTMIIGAAVILGSLLEFSANKLQLALLATIGSVVVILGLVIGLALNFYAMIKYNKGIF